MPKKPGDESPSISVLILHARSAFASEVSKSWERATEAGSPYAHVPPPSLLFSDYDAAFNNAINDLVIELEQARAELAEIRTLSKRKTFSEADPVCGRCLALAAERGETVEARTAEDGDTCSQCGGLVCQRRHAESEEHWRARYRAAGSTND